MRACDMRATCLQSVLRSDLRSAERERAGEGGGGRAGVEGQRPQAGADGTRAPGGGKVKREWEGCLAYCSAKCMPGGYREDGDRETEGQGPRDQRRGAREDEKGQQTGGRTGPGGRGRERGQEGALPRELLRIVLALAGGQRNREDRAGKRA